MFNFIKETRLSVDVHSISDDICREHIGKKKYNKKKEILYNPGIYSDLDFFSEKINVFDRINRTDTFFGEKMLKDKLGNFHKPDKPITVLDDLFFKEAMTEMNYFRENQKYIVSFDMAVNPVYNNIVVPFIDKIVDDAVKCFVQNVYNIFNIYLPIYNILSPIIFIVLFYIFKKILPTILVDKFYFILKVSMMGLSEINIFKINSFYTLVSTLFSLIFYVYNIYSSIKFSLITNILIKQIKTNLAVLKNITEKMLSLYRKNNLGCDKLVPIDFETGGTTNGAIMVVYNNVIKNKKIENYINYLSVLDYRCCLKKLLNTGYSVPKLLKSKKPVMIVKKLKNPLYDKFVENDITMHKNILLTGANAGGKSTLLRSILYNIVLSQTIGVCKCGYMLYTPFSQVISMIKVTDSDDRSLFENQINSMNKYLSVLKTQDKQQFSFLGVDEIFSGTNYNDAEISSEFYIDQISKLKNQLSLITTHLTEITNKKNNFSNYRMAIEKTGTKIEYSYKIKKGVNRLSVVNDMLIKII